MDITRFNQVVALADFAREVQRCEFCAVDQEMTGVDVPGVTAPFGSPPEDVYRVKRIAVEAYNAFQIGIALFTKTDTDTYEVRPYNFYLLNDAGDLRLSLSAISFLAANHMNFQTWLTSGLSFCDAHQEATFDAKHDAPFTNEAEQRLADDVVKAADEWFSTETAPLVRTLPCSTDLARRLHGYIGRHYDFRIVASFDGKPSLAQKLEFTLTKLDDVAWAAEKEKRLVQGERDRARQLGFRQFWKILVSSKKPIVGHNFMQDVMFMIHMHETPLPTPYADFKALLQRTLPTIYDTKTMATTLAGDNAFQVTHLGFLYQECRRRAGLSRDDFSRQYRLPPGFYSYNDYAVQLQSKAHEAAYDAYMTGIAYTLLHRMYPGAFAELRNVISAFGSVHYFCVDTADRLISPNTFILECTCPAYNEQVEALFFATEDTAACTAESGKVDLKKLSYHISGLSASADAKKFTSFCVRMKGDTTAQELHSRLQSLRNKKLPNETHVDLALLDCISVRTP
ncbi:poly(A)-specific ribonuclease PARN [Novymonas esmeraldas]|uniref:Poly(A)-specific ribonuclease PARN n=1 Tax=Novymonas esmeraldas TaxID=1808958 RepID=A0AAW0FDU3_9TRYP